MLELANANARRRVHFSGIGGTGMVGGARLAIEAGWEVRGSDSPLYPPTSEMVARLAVPVASEYSAANLDWDPDLVVIGNALSRGNPEVEAVLERRMSYVSLPEWIKAFVLRRRRPIVVAGTHGKTTTTSLIAFLLERTGLTPGYFIGGEALDFEHSAQLGAEGAPFVIEGDEYDTAFFDKRAKFLHYLPEIAVVTSVEFDHGDIYGSIEEIETAFQRMLRQIPGSGWLVACADDLRAASLVHHAYSATSTYGISNVSEWHGIWDTASRELIIERGGHEWTRMVPPLFGIHNLRNIVGAAAVAGLIGVSPDQVSEILPEFRGVRRRLEVFLQHGGVTFVDDFAHHPTAIRVTVTAARERWPGRPIRVLFEPRSNTVVTNQFQNELVDAFDGATEVWLGPIFRAERIPEKTRLNRELLAFDLNRKGISAHVADDVVTIVNRLTKSMGPQDIVLILSNGAFNGIYDHIRQYFRAVEKKT